MAKKKDKDFLQVFESLETEVSKVGLFSEPLEQRRKAYFVEGDYIGEDGLLYCGICKTRKEEVLNYTRSDGKTIQGIIYVPCEHKKEEILEEIKKQETLSNERYKMILKETTFKQKGYLDYTFEKAWKIPYIKKVKEYADNFEKMLQKGIGIKILGGTGSGKTYLIVALANALLDKGYSVYFTNVLDLIDDLSDDKKGDTIEKIDKSDLMIVEDFGIDKIAGSSANKLLKAIDRRIVSKKPLAITANITLDEMTRKAKDKNDVLAKVYSRILGNCVVTVKLEDKDLREIESSNLSSEISEPSSFDLDDSVVPF